MNKFDEEYGEVMDELNANDKMLKLNDIAAKDKEELLLELAKTKTKIEAEQVENVRNLNVEIPDGSLNPQIVGDIELLSENMININTVIEIAKPGSTQMLENDLDVVKRQIDLLARELKLAPEVVEYLYKIKAKKLALDSIAKQTSVVTAEKQALEDESEEINIQQKKRVKKIQSKKRSRHNQGSKKQVDVKQDILFSEFVLQVHVLVPE